jgi:non-specific serine/threonine protein kinase
MAQRCAAKMTTAYRFGQFELNPASRQLLVEGQPATLGTRAFDVLLILIERRERLVTKDELLDLAWPGLVVEENNLQVQISALRKIIGDRIIKTVPGRGYQFTGEVTRSALLERGDARRSNLPRPLTRFIGHEADLDDYQNIVATSRLVTLTGLGGCGKTRLAIELASRAMPMFAQGAWFVDLAPMADAERLPLTVARTLGLTERSGQSITETLCEHLAERQILLILDNCEHLPNACATLAAKMLERGSWLKVLATSREALGVSGEYTLRVRSLKYPPPDRGDGVDQIQAFEAVQLFVDRARLINHHFALDRATAPAVAEICRRLDGIPLAIELAAARTKILSVNDLRQMLDDRFSLLVGGSRMAPARQQTLLATIKWSFDLLAQDERQLLEQLSIFSGGWTLEAAAAVAGEDADQYEVLDRLARLADKSLIAARTEGEATRYSMLETVCEYGLEALAASGAEPGAAKRHLEYFVGLAERLEPAFMTSGEREALDQLAPELENIVQALRGCERVSGGPELALRLVASLGQFWLSLGLVELGYRLTAEALARGDAQDPSPARLRALFEAERFLQFLDRLGEARDRQLECLALARQLHDDHITAGVLAHLGSNSFELGDAEQAVAFCEEALRLARDRADCKQVRRALCALGEVHCASGNPELALPLWEECLQLGRDQRDAHSVVAAACDLARTYISCGKAERARPLVVEALALSWETQSKLTLQWVLDAVTALTAAAQDGATAARMLGAADAARKLVGNRRDFSSLQFWPSTVTSIRNSLREADFVTAYDAGKALTIEQAIGEARGWLEKFAPSAESVR